MDQALPTTPATPKRFGRAARWILRACLWALLACEVFSYLGTFFFYADILSNFRLQFFLLFGAAVLLCYFARVRGLLLIGLLAALAWSGLETFSIWLPAQQPAAGETVVRLMSFNILATNDAYEPVIQQVRQHDPDVLVVIEYAGMWHEVFNALQETYPFAHRDPAWHGYGIAVFSKMPLETARSVPLTEGFGIDVPAADVALRVDGQLLHLTAAHVMSPVTFYRHQLRNEQFKEIAEIVGSHSGPAILAGDMNCTTASSYLAALVAETGLRDSRQGRGIHCSWVKYAPLVTVPIDHAFVSPQIRIHDRFLGNAANSDHRPLVVDFSITPKERN